MEKESFALEILSELKQQNARQQETINKLQKTININLAVIVIMIIAIVGMIIGFFAYESQFETVTEQGTIEQSQEETNNSSMIGEIN